MHNSQKHITADACLRDLCGFSFAIFAVRGLNRRDRKGFAEDEKNLAPPSSYLSPAMLRI
jgi:hypothetical protein